MILSGARPWSRAKRWQFESRLLGLCIYCRQPTEKPGGAMCARHRATASAYSKRATPRRRERYAKEGRCVVCGQRATGNVAVKLPLCDRHREMGRARVRRMRARS